jgi:hypothetical protein
MDAPLVGRVRDQAMYLHIGVHHLTKEAKLTEAEQQQKLQAWMRAKFPTGLTCPACRRSNWQALPLVVVPNYTSGGFSLGGPTVPMVPLACNNCAHIMLFAAVPLGLASSR